MKLPLISLLKTAAASLLLSASSLSLHASETSSNNTDIKWYPYPTTAKAFNYDASTMQASWSKLVHGDAIKWPDQAFIQKRLSEFPFILPIYQAISNHPIAIPEDFIIPEQFEPLVNKLKQEGYQLELKDVPKAVQPIYLRMMEHGVHPAIPALLDGDYAPMEAAIKQSWIYHFNGEFEKAYRLGMRLGPVGFDGAIYAYLMHATFLIEDEKEKAHTFLVAAKELAQIQSFAGENPLPRFAAAYAKMRYLDTLGTMEARSTGWMDALLEDIDYLLKQDPSSTDYYTMKGGFYGGMVGRVGSTIASMMYGVDDDEALEAFNIAVEKNAFIAQTFNEYAFALYRMDFDDYEKDIQQLLTHCLTINTVSAHEELNRLNCEKQMSQYFESK